MPAMEPRRRSSGRFWNGYYRIRHDGAAMIVRKTPSEVEKMRRSGLLVREILKTIGEMCVVGTNTMDLEHAALKMMSDAGAKPAFKDYYVPAAGARYRFAMCISVNDEIVQDRK